MDPVPGQPSEEWRGRAGALVQAVTAPRHFDAARGLFGTRRHLAGRAYEHLWPFACAWSAMETAADLAGAAGSRAGEVADALAAGLAAYGPAGGGGAPSARQAVGDRPDTSQLQWFESSVGAPLGRGGDVFYDDNAWVALALLEHHRRRRDPSSLALARRVVAFCCTGWSGEAAWPVPGGIRWKVRASNRSRNTCANAPVAQAAALVHARTGDTQALDWAVRIYDWVRSALLGPDDLYLDRIMPDGTRAPERWTYNQGTMIGAGVLLAEATGERHYLEDACRTAEASLARFDLETLQRPNGPAFNAILFRNLFLLDRRIGDPRISALASDYGDRTWERGPKRRTGPLGRAPRTLNATAPLIEIYALLAGATPHP